MARSQVKGYRGTARAIRKMSQIQRPISESSRFALRPILNTAKANLRANGNIKSGDLLRGMAIRKKKAKRGVSETVVAATGKGVKNAHLVEFGTDPHWQPKRRQMHPGAKPFPFLTPAYSAHDDEVLKRFGSEIGKSMERQAKRVAARKR